MSSRKVTLHGENGTSTNKPSSQSNSVALLHGATRATSEPGPQTDVDQPSEDRAEMQLGDGSPQQGNNSSEGAAKSSDQDSTVNSLPVNQQSAEPSKDSGGSSSSESSQDNWEFEQIAILDPDSPLQGGMPFPYSDWTLRQIDTISQLVEDQEKETEDKRDMLWKDVGGPLNKFLDPESPFAVYYDETQEAIAKAYDELLDLQEKKKDK